MAIFSNWLDIECLTKVAVNANAEVGDAKDANLQRLHGEKPLIEEFA